MRNPQVQTLSPILAVKHDDGGRLFDFRESFLKINIDFRSDILDVSDAIARLTSTDISAEGLHHPCSCNGPHHALIVAKLSYVVVSEMLEHTEMRGKIDTIMQTFNDTVRMFLCDNNYHNYKKLVELIALFHDTGRPSDGIDRWEKANQINVETNLRYFLQTTGLSAGDVELLMKHVNDGIECKDKARDDTGFLFGAPVGAGDSLHSGHAFHGGLWDSSPYDPDYARLYRQYPSFRETFTAIQADATKFIPRSTEHRLAAVFPYLNAPFQRYGDGSSDSASFLL